MRYSKTTMHCDLGCDSGVGCLHTYIYMYVHVYVPVSSELLCPHLDWSSLVPAVI